MALHARRKGINAALINFTWCALSLIDDLPKLSNIITFSFFIALRCYLHLKTLSLMSKKQSVLKLYSIA
jgi:hypothetical protein